MNRLLVTRRLHAQHDDGRWTLRDGSAAVTLPAGTRVHAIDGRLRIDVTGPIYDAATIGAVAVERRAVPGGGESA